MLAGIRYAFRHLCSFPGFTLETWVSSISL